MLGTRQAETERDGQVRASADALHELLAARGHGVARPGDAEPRDGVEKAASEPAGRVDTFVRAGWAEQSHQIDAGRAQARLHRARLFDRQIQQQHTVDAGTRRPFDEGVFTHAQHRIRVGEQHDWRRDASAHV